MKTNQKTIIVIGVLLIGAITLFVGSFLTNQNNHSAELSSFIISVKTDGNKIAMTCEKGCAWEKLTYTTKLNEKRVIDEYGIQLPQQVSDKKDAYLANFLFNIEKTEKGIKLKGLEGTAWIDLEFTLAENRFQKLDNLGMIK